MILIANLAEAGDEPAADEKSVATLARANNAFAIDLYQKLAAQPGNICLSPYSVSSAFGLVLAGAKGETADAIRKTLRLGEFPAEKPEVIHQAFRLLRSNVTTSAEGCTVSIANVCWLSKEAAFQKEFSDIAKASYDADLAQLDFAHDPGSARLIINTWIEANMHGNIKDTIGALDKQTEWVLANAICFNDKWASEFKRESTKPKYFHPGGDTTESVSMMTQELYFQYTRDDQCQILELPYIGGKLSMVVLLPIKMDGLPELEKALTAEWLEKHLTKLQKTAVVASLPRFNFGSRFELNETLQTLGMKLAGDFSGISAVKVGISLVVHQCYVDVNESGTVAAAATVVIAAKNGGGHPEHFNADHPFIFLIRDVKSGALLFMGRVTDPNLSTEQPTEEKREPKK